MQVQRMKPTLATIETEKYIDDYTEEHGYPPTYEEIADYFGLKSTGAAYSRARYCRHKMIQQPKNK